MEPSRRTFLRVDKGSVKVSLRELSVPSVGLMTALVQSKCRIRARWSRPGKVISCSTVVSGPRMSKRAKITEPPRFTHRGVRVPMFAQVARSKTVLILASAPSCHGFVESKECRTLQQFFGDVSICFRVVCSSTQQKPKDHSFSGCNYAAFSREGDGVRRERGRFQKVSFYVRVLRRISGELKNCQDTANMFLTRAAIQSRGEPDSATTRMIHAYMAPRSRGDENCEDRSNP